MVKARWSRAIRLLLPPLLPSRNPQVLFLPLNPPPSPLPPPPPRPSHPGVKSGLYQGFIADRILLVFLANSYGASDASLYVSPVIEENPFSFAFNFEPNNTLRAFVDLGILQALKRPEYTQQYTCVFCTRSLSGRGVPGRKVLRDSGSTACSLHPSILSCSWVLVNLLCCWHRIPCLCTP